MNLPTDQQLIDVLKPLLIDISEAGNEFKSLTITLDVSSTKDELDLGVWISSAEHIARGKSIAEVRASADALRPENFRATKIAELEKELAKLKGENA